MSEYREEDISPSRQRQQQELQQQQQLECETTLQNVSFEEAAANNVSKFVNLAWKHIKAICKVIARCAVPFSEFKGHFKHLCQ